MARASKLALGLALALTACATNEPTSVEHDTARPNQVGASTERPLSVFVRYRSNAIAGRIAATKQRGASFAYDIDTRRTLALSVPASLVDSLRTLPWVESIEVDSSVGHLLADFYPWGIDSTGAHTVQSFARGTGVKLGFLHGGSRCSWADLSARIVGGYDFVNNTSSYCQNSGDGFTIDHGTSVAQVLGASINGLNWVGMAPEANLYNLRICDSDGACTPSRLVTALHWAVLNSVKVLNMSFGTCNPISQAVKDAIAEAYAASIVMMWAAGNGTHDCNGNVSFVSPYLLEPGVIGVAGYRRQTGYVTDYSQHAFIDISAPTGVFVTTIYGATVDFDGTSAATPHAAGAAAILVGLGFSGADLIAQRLTSTAIDRGPVGKDIYYGWGIIDLTAAAKVRPTVTALTGAAPPFTTAGTYPLSATIADGIAPFGVEWRIEYSQPVHSNVVTSYGAATYNLEVPAGSYNIRVTATPKGSVWLRVGNPIIQDFPVCTGGGGALRLPSDSSVTDAVGGC